MTGHLKDNYDNIRWLVITYRSASRRAATSNELLQIWLTSYRNNSNDYTVCSWLRRVGNASQGVSLYFIFLSYRLHPALNRLQFAYMRLFLIVCLIYLSVSRNHLYFIKRLHLFLFVCFPPVQEEVSHLFKEANSPVHLLLDLFPTCSRRKTLTCSRRPPPVLPLAIPSPCLPIVESSPPGNIVSLCWYSQIIIVDYQWDHHCHLTF